MRIVTFCLFCLLCLGVRTGLCQEEPSKKQTEKQPSSTQKADTQPQASAKKKGRGTKGQAREPFKITREFEAQMEEVEPPELEVTGIFQAKGKTVAMAKLQLERVEGRVALKPGMRVSIPKPEREESESERWMTYFTVKEISPSGMVIVLENGETVWYPVMGELD
jgi:hypothetical protein